MRIGRGDDYVPSAIPSMALADKLRISMKDRRDFAWQVVEKMLQPKKIKLLDGVTEVDVPLWHTWYEGSGNPEVRRLLKLYFEKLKPVLQADPNADVTPVIADTMKEFSEKDLSTSLTDANMSAVLFQNKSAEVPAELLGTGTTMFSPSFVEHVMKEARGISECKREVATASQNPPSPDEFSYCMKEFPRSAVMVKTSWERLQDKLPKHDTTAPAMTAVIQEGTWPGPGHPTKKPPVQSADRAQAYTVVTEQETEWALTGVHFVTKDVREWVWVSLWWDPSANEDFGADRPSSLDKYNNGVWKNYKMCVSSAFDEGDSSPWSRYSGAQNSLRNSIEAVYRAIQMQIQNGAQLAAGQTATPLPGGLGPWPAPNNIATSWCSNPNVEWHSGNGRTSCIGCHQIVYTRNEKRNTNASFAHILIGDYPQLGRAVARKNFTGEFSWAFEFELLGDARNLGDIPQGMKDAGFSWPPR